VQACTQTHHFEIKKNAKIIWGGGHPLLRPHPLGAYGASIFAPTALKLNVTPPRKILVTALNKANGEEGMRGGAEHPQIFRWIDAFDTAINDMLILNKFYIFLCHAKT